MTFPAPTGDAASLNMMAGNLSKIAADLSAQATSAQKAMATSLGDWKAPRADDFREAAQALVDELFMSASAVGTVSNAISAYAKELTQTTIDIAGYNNSANTEVTDANNRTNQDPSQGDTIWITESKVVSGLRNTAAQALTELNNYAVKIAAAIDAETDLAVPKSSGLTPDEIRRRVDASMGISPALLTDFGNGTMTLDEAWTLVQTPQGTVFTSVVPVPGQSNFGTWFASLTPLQQELESQKLQSGFNTKGFNPYSTVQGGDLPEWADQFNANHVWSCTIGGDEKHYGYFGGGTILGPGGAQWPIVMPYYQDGKNIYMADDGATPPNGGINELDGQDPGWTTVATYSGLGQFGTISGWTKAAAAFLIGTGQELETNPTDPGAVTVNNDGVPFAGHDVPEPSMGPADKPYWDVDSDTMMPKPMEDLPPGSIQPNLEYNEAALGGASLLVQAGQAATAVQNIDSHASRQWYVSYQINSDGRTRAIVHTYSAGPTEDGKTVVGSFANGFPTGQSGTTSEIPYNTRYTPYTTPVMTATPDPNVDYSGRGDPLDNDVPIQEKLNK
jgi:hypothetical protein